METKSTFTIMGSGIGFSGGNYRNFEPSDAAKKAGRALFKQLEDPKFRKYKNKTTIRFILRKRDRKSAGKTYAYEVSRTKLKKPIVVKRGDAEYTVKYDYHITSCSMDATEVKKMTGGCLGCAIGGNRKLRKGGNEGEDVEGVEGGEGEAEGEAEDEEVSAQSEEVSAQSVQSEEVRNEEVSNEEVAVQDVEDNNTPGAEGSMTGGKKRQSKNAKNTKNAKNAKNTKNTKNAKNAKANKKK